MCKTGCGTNFRRFRDCIFYEAIHFDNEASRCFIFVRVGKSALVDPNVSYRFNY